MPTSPSLPTAVRTGGNRCPKCGGPWEPTVLTGPVLRQRRRLPLVGGAHSRMRGETCVDCGYTELFAEHPTRFPLEGENSDVDPPAA